MNTTSLRMFRESAQMIHRARREGFINYADTMKLLYTLARMNFRE
jgi:hypothetical protein